MSDNKKKNEEVKKQNEAKEVSIDILGDVAGGALKNVIYTPTKPISEDTKKKV